MAAAAPDRMPQSNATPVGLLVGVALALAVGAVDAQQRLYRIVEPDGRVTFTDRPPASASSARVAPPNVPAAPPIAGLPTELAAIVGRFPVMLLTGPDCEPCSDGRALLRERGIPYTERLVTTPRDQAELRRLSGGVALPALLVGRQPVSGLRASDWQAWLDAAGYPPRSQLPASWRASTPAPLAPPLPEAAATATPAPVAPPAQPGPGGIRF
jgi:glutaredoxin